MLNDCCSRFLDIAYIQLRELRNEQSLLADFD